MIKYSVSALDFNLEKKGMRILNDNKVFNTHEEAVENIKEKHKLESTNEHFNDLFIKQEDGSYITIHRGLNNEIYKRVYIVNKFEF